MVVGRQAFPIGKVTWKLWEGIQLPLRLSAFTSIHLSYSLGKKDILQTEKFLLRTCLHGILELKLKGCSSWWSETSMCFFPSLCLCHVLQLYRWRRLNCSFFLCLDSDNFDVVHRRLLCVGTQQVLMWIYPWVSASCIVFACSCYWSFNLNFISMIQRFKPMNFLPR